MLGLRGIGLALLLAGIGVTSVIAEVVPPSINDPSPGKATFRFYGLPPGARIFFQNTEFTDTFAPYIANGSLKIFSRPITDGATYQTEIRVETPAADGRYSSWKTVRSYSAGSVVVINPYTPSPATNDNIGHLRVIVTLDTLIFINGRLTLQEGEVRDFSTPPLDDGKPFNAKVKFDFRNKTGRRIIRTKAIQIRPGETVNFFNIEKLTDEVAAEG